MGAKLGSIAYPTVRLGMKAAKSCATKATIRFRVKVLSLRTGSNKKIGSWTLILPKSASAKLPSGGIIMVEGTINAFPFRAALTLNSKKSHSLAVNKMMREGAGADVDDTVEVEIARAGDEPEIRVPRDLRKALAAAPLAQAGWADITPLARRDWVFSISTAKLAATRRRRIEKACDMLACGKRRLCCFPGVEWIMRDNAKSCGIWLPLPKLQNRFSPRTAD
jgi:hypothetical protein